MKYNRTLQKIERINNTLKFALKKVKNLLQSLNQLLNFAYHVQKIISTKTYNIKLYSFEIITGILSDVSTSMGHFLNR